jgi:microcystin-dependent protein
MAILSVFAFLLLKLLAYTGWCALGYLVLAPERPRRAYRSLRLGAFRLATGFVLGWIYVGALGLGNTTGALPIANGGTGQATVAAARNAFGLGNTSGPVPLANGGTGATTAAGVLDVLKQTLLNYQYPIGIIVQLTVSTSPSTLWGYGTWVRIQDVFLLASGSTYALGETGGEANHTLTVDEMPSHQHNFLNSKIGGTGTTQWVWASGGGQNTGAITDTGGSAAHNNMPPYLAVYIWKRTA